MGGQQAPRTLPHRQRGREGAQGAPGTVPSPRFGQGLRGAGGPPPRRPSRPPPERHVRTDTGNCTCPGTGGPEAAPPARGRLPHGAAGASTSARAATTRGGGGGERGAEGDGPTAANRRGAPRASTSLRWGGKERPARRAPLRSARPWRAAAAQGFQAARAQGAGPAPAGETTCPGMPRAGGEAVGARAPAAPVRRPGPVRPLGRLWWRVWGRLAAPSGLTLPSWSSRNGSRVGYREFFQNLLFHLQPGPKDEDLRAECS